ncbi:MAG TPA: hypothetical protein VM487_18340 [Phycisphaerae bacterium]|nr:hypothetical protein [Phycisphaerae bacterium]
MGETVHVRRCTIACTGLVIELPVEAFVAGTIQSFVNHISEPYILDQQTETAMSGGGQHNAMRKRATARG